MLVLKQVVAADEMQTFICEYNKLANMNVHMDYALGCDIFGWVDEKKSYLAAIVLPQAKRWHGRS